METIDIDGPAIRLANFDGFLIDRCVRFYQLDIQGIHGIAHWGRVYDNGLRLLQIKGIDVPEHRRIVAMFAMFHDVARANDGLDKLHGFRGALRVGMEKDLTAWTTLQKLSSHDLVILTEALIHHDDCWISGQSEMHPHAVIQTCWDADRLDLPRCCVEPRGEMLSHEARGIAIWARENATAWRKQKR